MDANLDGLSERIAALTQRLAGLGARLADAGLALQETGAPPGDGLVEALSEAREEFLDLRAGLREATEALGISGADGDPETVGDLEPVLAALAEEVQARERQAALEAARGRALAVLADVVDLAHRDERGFAALVGCQQRARELAAWIEEVTDAGTEDAAGIDAAVQPFVDLLAMVDEVEVDEERYAEMEERVSAAFGRPLAVAAARGRLCPESELPPPEPIVEPELEPSAAMDEIALGPVQEPIIPALEPLPEPEPEPLAALGETPLAPTLEPIELAPERLPEPQRDPLAGLDEVDLEPEPIAAVDEVDLEPEPIAALDEAALTPEPEPIVPAPEPLSEPELEPIAALDQAAPAPDLEPSVPVLEPLPDLEPEPVGALGEPALAPTLEPMVSAPETPPEPKPLPEPEPVAALDEAALAVDREPSVPVLEPLPDLEPEPVGALGEPALVPSLEPMVSTPETPPEPEPLPEPSVSTIPPPPLELEPLPLPRASDVTPEPEPEPVAVPASFDTTGDETAQWWLAAWARWSGWRETVEFPEAVKEELGKYAYLLSVPIRKAAEYEDGLVAYGYSILMDHVERQSPGCIGNALNSLKSGVAPAVGDQLYDYLVAHGRLEETYGDFVRSVLVAAIPEPGLWFQFRILDSKDDTRIIQRPSARIGDTELSGRRLSAENQRFAEHKFKMALPPLTARFVLLSADTREARGIAVRLLVDGRPSTRGWIVTLSRTRGKVEARPMVEGGTQVLGFGKDWATGWIAVYNSDPHAEQRYELGVVLRKDARTSSRARSG